MHGLNSWRGRKLRRFYPGIQLPICKSWYEIECIAVRCGRVSNRRYAATRAAAHDAIPVPFIHAAVRRACWRAPSAGYAVCPFDTKKTL